MNLLSNIQVLPLYLLAFLAALGVIVFIHELGHYLLGRWTGIRAEVFSIGFGRPLASFYDRHGTKWQIAIVPLGGYVKFLGDANAASGKAEGEFYEDLDEETKRSTMHGAPLYARALTVLGGPVFNFILAIVIFAGLFLVQGKATDQPTIGELLPGPYDLSALQVGDEIVGINGVPIDGFEAMGEVMEDLPSVAQVSYDISRGSDSFTALGPFPLPARVSLVQPQSAAFDAGIKLGDVITRVDDLQINAFKDIVELVKVTGDKPLEIAVWRDGEEFTFNLVPRRMDLELPEGGFESRYLIGLQGGDLFFEPLTVAASPIEAIKFGAERTWGTISSTVSMLTHVVTGQIDRCNVRGVLTIAEVSGATATQSGFVFISFIAGLSVAIGFINLLPIPVLDGGHLVFHVFEAMFGRPPSDKALNVMMTIGLVLVMGLMLFALSNDILCR